ncbi:MerR family transcriptional regulator [Actinokineospora globicatena]|uniref:transcriptional regulator FtsR n=1 Tax=Actinokineospora globicatena TaxID=103729 RepID=UPI0020A27D2E|nr:MerR family transcriptional regulator [Actinokineospora globicatena]MCP2304644.1 MerR family regulatory protein [Actinokineospora globicatena]GLW77984.1 MerR family transcriptional regulator [Actinokineospora globicatena]GLW85350.1 MerR family transcriptional regulator [Actinokineospora globicatena]
MTAAGRASRAGSSIGAVLSQLRPEFPDVTISKIRFLEAEGLVSPERTPSGYRRFTAADVARLRFVLAAQRDHYLPLKVIKEQLDRPGGPPEQVARPARGLIAVPALPEPVATVAPMSRDDLLDRARIPERILAELEQYGLLAASADGAFDAEALAVATTASALADYGIEPRHLRAFRAAADREVALLEQVLAPVFRQRDPAARARADESADDLAALAITLHSLLVRTGLRRVTQK